MRSIERCEWRLAVPTPTVSDGTPMPNTVVPRARVLVIDDEPTVRTVARMMLERSGFAVEEVADGEAGLAALASAARPFLAVVLDVSLPDRSGLELIPQIRALASETPVVLSSGRPEEDVPGHGADTFLAKPFNRERLVTALREATAARA
jgi:CheY-like chemotaxis protein